MHRTPDRTTPHRLRTAARGAVALLLAALAGVAVAADALRVQGTAVKLAPPEGFVASERFPGFRNDDGTVSIMVTEMPGPFAEVRKMFEGDGLAKRGVKLLSVTEVTANGAPALLGHAEQAQQGTEFAKWMLIGGDATGSVLIVANYPKSAAAVHEEPLRAALLGATWTAGAARDPFEGLPFRLTATETLKLARRVSNNVAFTESGKLPPASPDEALFVIGVSTSAVAPADLAAFSAKRARATESLTGFGDLVGASVKVAGFDAYEVVVPAKDAKTGAAKRLFQVIALDGSGYWVAQGIAPEARADAMIGEFRKIVASLRRAPADGGSEAPAPKAPVPGTPPGKPAEGTSPTAPGPATPPKEK